MQSRCKQEFVLWFDFDLEEGIRRLCISLWLQNRKWRLAAYYFLSSWRKKTNLFKIFFDFSVPPVSQSTQSEFSIRKMLQCHIFDLIPAPQFSYWVGWSLVFLKSFLSDSSEEREIRGRILSSWTILRVQCSQPRCQAVPSCTQRPQTLLVLVHLS